MIQTITKKGESSEVKRLREHRRRYITNPDLLVDERGEGGRESKNIKSFKTLKVDELAC